MQRHLLSPLERRQGSTRVPGHVPSFRDVAHGGVLCSFNIRSAPDRGNQRGPSMQAAVLGQPSSLRPRWSAPPPPPKRTPADYSQCYSDNFCLFL